MGERAKLTDKQAAILKFVRKSIKARGVPPTRQEIADEFGLASANGAHQHLLAIALKGHIQLTHIARGIRVL